MNNITHVKLLFTLVQDEDGYPPDKYESLWAKKLSDNTFEIDNIPFFVQGISCGDIVEAEFVDGELCFKNVLKQSGNSTLRVICFDTSIVGSVRTELKRLGCSSELSHIEGLIAIDIPSTCNYGPIQKYLEKKEHEDKLEYEEACLNH